MIFKEIYTDVLNSFGQLWSYKERGKTLEIITPFSTVNQKFASVFLTEREGEIIVSDGGWIYDGIYGTVFDTDIPCYSKIVSHFIESYDIRETRNGNGSMVFFKKSKNSLSIPSLVFDMANFVSTLVSTATVEFVEKEKETERFRSTARDYLENLRVNGNWKFNEYLGGDRVKVDAIYVKSSDALVVLNFITGSDHNYFQSNISKANMVFEIADKTPEGPFIENKLALIDNKARGYKLERISYWLEHLASKSEPVYWSKRDQLSEYLT